MSIAKYEASFAEDFKDRLLEDEILERYKNDPRVEAQLESSRPSASVLSDSEYFDTLGKIFTNDLSDDQAVSKFLSFGGIVLKPEEAKKLKGGNRSIKL
jgi:hypothetical protein